MLTEERKKVIDGFNEVLSYFYIDGAGAFIWNMKHNASHGRIDMTPELQKSIVELREEQEYCAKQLVRFGVDPETVRNRPDGDYWKWYNHWHTWHHGMDENTWREVDRRLTAEEDLTEFLPKHKWNEKPVENNLFLS